MSGAERRRGKRRRRLATLAVTDRNRFQAEIDRKVVDLLHQAGGAGAALAGRGADRHGAAALEALAARVDDEVREVVDLLASVVVHGGAGASALGWTEGELAERRRRAVAVARELAEELRRGPVRLEVADAAARSISVALGLPLHRLISTGYRQDRYTVRRSSSNRPNAA